MAPQAQNPLGHVGAGVHGTYFRHVAGEADREKSILKVNV